MGMSDDVLATDPASGYDPGSWLLFNNVFQSLLSFPKGGTDPEPEAAESCGFTDSDSKVYSCTLRDGLKFSNGDALTSEDVKFSFDRTMKINDAHGPAVMLPTIDDDRAPRTRRPSSSTSSTPTPPSPARSPPAPARSSTTREYPADKLRTDGKAVGSGPYKLDSFDEKQAVFSVNEDYQGTAKVQELRHDAEVLPRRPDRLKTALRERRRRPRLPRSGRRATSPTLQRATPATSQGIKVVEGTSAEVQHLVFNMNDPVAGKLGRPQGHRLPGRPRGPRQRRLPAHRRPRCTRSSRPASPATTPPSSTRYGDRPHAGQGRRPRCAAAGITGKVKLTLWSTPVRYGPATDQEFKAIAKQLNASGLFDADVKSVAFDQYEKDIAAGKYGVYVQGLGPRLPGPGQLHRPRSSARTTCWPTTTATTTITGALIPSTAAAADRAATDADFGELQDIVAEDVPILPLWQGKQYAVARDNIYGLEWTLDASTVFRFWEISKG